MASYESFARVYDELMDNVPYEQWADRIQKLLKTGGIRDGLMLELGCGTGKMLNIMDRRGFDMIGVDSSVEMLQIAEEKAGDNRPLLLLLQDMRNFELYGTVASVICVCDTVNYITSPEELTGVFRLVNNYLDPGGIFIFDFNTEYKYKDLMGDSVIAEDREDVSFIWYNEYETENHLNYIDLSVFVRETDGRYRKFTEEHIQRGYTLHEIKLLLEESGMDFLAAYDGYTEKEADAFSERIVVVAREKGKSKNKEE